MAVIAEVTLRGITPEQYDAVRDRAGHLEQVPEGAIAHLTWWEGEDCHNLDGWESEPFGGVYSGPQGAAEFFTKLSQSFAELRVEPEGFIDAGDTVVVPGRHRGRTVTGNAFDVPFVHVWTYRNGKVTAFTEVMDS